MAITIKRVEETALALFLIEKGKNMRLKEIGSLQKNGAYAAAMKDPQKFVNMFNPQNLSFEQVAKIVTDKEICLDKSEHFAYMDRDAYQRYVFTKEGADSVTVFKVMPKVLESKLFHWEMKQQNPRCRDKYWNHALTAVIDTSFVRFTVHYYLADDVAVIHQTVKPWNERAGVGTDRVSDATNEKILKVINFRLNHIMDLAKGTRLLVDDSKESQDEPTVSYYGIEWR